MLSQKTQYALRAVYDLARHYGGGPVKISEIARRQAIPQRFLEIILHQLKPVFVDSKRGQEGGYFLVRDPSELTVGEVLRFVQGPVGPVECTVSASGGENCPLREECVFLSLWQEVQEATDKIYDHTTFQQLVEREEAMRKTYVPAYAI